jgi:enoyl-CoA hydratase/carnithine racemase
LASEVELTHDGPVATITIDNPPVNALSPRVGEALSAHIEDIARRPELRAVVLTGTGRHFVAGADINFLQTIDRYSAERYALEIQGMQDALGCLPQPVIAAINGTALGGGCELAMACDIRIAEEHAQLGQPEVCLGLIPGAGGTQNLPRLVPVGRAKRLLFTGERIDAREALVIGLVDEVVSPGTSLARAHELATRIAANAPLAVTAAKRAVNLGLQASVLDGHRFEAALFSSLVGTKDLSEGTKAFFEKRAPRFKRE